MFVQQLINGIALGGIYALITIGYSMVYGVMRLMNFAHGDIYMVGTFIAYTLCVRNKMSIFVAALAGMLVGGILAALVEVLAYRRLRMENRAISMITALGAAYLIQNSEELVWGVEVQRFPSIFATETFNMLGLNISTVQLFTLVLSVVLIVGFHLFLTYNKWGKAILCVAQDIPTTRLMGVPINRTISLVYVLGGFLGVIGGILYCSAYNVIMIAMGFAGTIQAFTAAILGGIGNLKGAIFGSLILGVIQSLAGGYLSTTYRDAISFLILIGVLLIRPSGIFNKGTVEKV